MYLDVNSLRSGLAIIAALSVSFCAACGAAPSAAAPAGASPESATGAFDTSGPGVVVGNVTSEAAAPHEEKLDGAGTAQTTPTTTATDGRITEPKKSIGGKEAHGEQVLHRDSDPLPMQAPGAATTTSLGRAISADDIDTAIAPHLRALRECATLDSSVSVRVSIAPGGKVADVSATRSTPDDARMRDCVELALRTVSFKSSTSDRGTALSFDLDLKPLPAH